MLSILFTSPLFLASGRGIKDREKPFSTENSYISANRARKNPSLDKFFTLITFPAVSFPPKEL